MIRVGSLNGTTEEVYLMGRDLLLMGKLEGVGRRKYLMVEYRKKGTLNG